VRLNDRLHISTKAYTESSQHGASAQGQLYPCLYLRTILGDFKTELNKKLQSWSETTVSDKWINKFPYKCTHVLLHCKWNYHVAWFYVRTKPFQQNIQRAKLCPVPKTCSAKNSALHRRQW